MNILKKEWVHLAGIAALTLLAISLPVVTIDCEICGKPSEGLEGVHYESCIESVARRHIQCCPVFCLQCLEKQCSNGTFGEWKHEHGW